MTLVFVLMVTSVKEGLEDLDRARYVTYFINIYIAYYPYASIYYTNNCYLSMCCNRSDRDENIRKATIVTFDSTGQAIEKVVETQQVYLACICIYIYTSIYSHSSCAVDSIW
jgi:hypothetical protein